MGTQQATTTPTWLPITVPPWLVDLALVAVAVVLPTARRAFTEHEGPLTTADLVAGVIAGVLVPLRRRLPVESLAVGVVAAAVLTMIAHRPTVLLAAVIVVLFTVSTRFDRRLSLWAGALTLLTLVTSVVVFASQAALGGAALASVAWPALAVAAGDVRRSHLSAIEEQARRVEENQATEAQRQIIEERLRIARELHDVVAHRMAVVNVQAGVAAHLLRSRPDDAEQALAVVRSSARVVLEELSSILSVLRHPHEAADPTAPTPGMAELPALIASFGAAGLVVHHTTSGPVPSIPAATGLAIYRTVQEGLTNAHKHGTGPASLSILHGSDQLTIGIENDVAPGATDGDPEPRGFGLIGMRERLIASDGTLTAGPSEPGRFRLVATLPVPTRRLPTEEQP